MVDLRFTLWTDLEEYMTDGMKGNMTDSFFSAPMLSARLYSRRA